MPEKKRTASGHIGGEIMIHNPIFKGFNPDPCICRKGDDYYIAVSTFEWMPGIPVYHSKDMKNWELYTHVLTDDEEVDLKKLPSAKGIWAPCLTYCEQEDLFYVVYGVMNSMNARYFDVDNFVITAKDIRGPWSKPVYLHSAGFDASMFHDDDGRKYIVSLDWETREGYEKPGFIAISEYDPEKKEIIGYPKRIWRGGTDRGCIEAPHLTKRNGYYYIFAPAGGVKPGWQTVLRSKNIYGPWEEKIVLHQGNSPVNGPHQGAWVDTPDGQDWFLHFQDVGNAGRIVHLQPMHWENDWPVIGVNAVDGCGEPVLRYKKPEVGAAYPIDTPEDSDFFEGDRLGLQWQWNANYKKEWYDLKDGQLLLHAQAADPKTQLCDISNLLLQKWPAPEFSVTTCLHLEQMKDGDVAGLVSLGGCYTALAVQKIHGKMSLQQRTGNWTKDDEVRTGLGEWNSDVIYIQMKVEKETYRTFYVGTTEENLQPVGQMVEATPGRWVGVKDGLFAINEQGMEGGLVAADYFVYQEL